MFDYLARRFGARGRDMATRVIEIARGEGLVMDYERGLSVNTLNAHRLLILAEREHGPVVQRELIRRLFRAHFAEGKDVGDLVCSPSLAADVGMDTDAARNYLETDRGTREVREGIAEAQRLGVRPSPPMCSTSRYVVEGAQPTELFLEALTTSPARRRRTTSPADRRSRQTRRGMRRVWRASATASPRSTPRRAWPSCPP